LSQPWRGCRASEPGLAEKNFFFHAAFARTRGDVRERLGANEILTRLATVRDLKVISRTSTAKYQSRPDNLKKVAQELGVSTVLEGAVQKAGDKVRVNVQLIDARADTHLWAKVTTETVGECDV